MFSSYYAQHSHNLPPQCFTFLCVHQGSNIKQNKKNTNILFFYLQLLLSFPPPFSMPPLLSCLFMLSFPPCCHPTSFPFLNSNKLPQGFTLHLVMILTLLPF